MTHHKLGEDKGAFPLTKEQLPRVQCYVSPFNTVDGLKNVLSDTCTIRSQGNAMSNVGFTNVDWGETIGSKTHMKHPCKLYMLSQSLAPEAPGYFSQNFLQPWVLTRGHHGDPEDIKYGDTRNGSRLIKGRCLLVTKHIYRKVIPVRSVPRDGQALSSPEPIRQKVHVLFTTPFTPLSTVLAYHGQDTLPHSVWPCCAKGPVQSQGFFLWSERCRLVMLKSGSGFQGQWSQNLWLDKRWSIAWSGWWKEAWQPRRRLQGEQYAQVSTELGENVLVRHYGPRWKRVKQNLDNLAWFATKLCLVMTSAPPS